MLPALIKVFDLFAGETPPVAPPVLADITAGWIRHRRGRTLESRIAKLKRQLAKARKKHALLQALYVAAGNDWDVRAQIQDRLKDIIAEEEKAYNAYIEAMREQEMLGVALTFLLTE